MPQVFLAPGTFGAGGQFFTSSGKPLNGGLIYTYIAGGTTPQATYTTSAGNVQNANPIQLDADGRAPNEIWITNADYRFDLKDANDNLIKTYDDLSGINNTTVIANVDMDGFILTDLGNGSSATDSANIGQIQSGFQTLGSISGTNTITAIASPTPSLVVGSRFWFVPANTNSGATTININSLGAKSIFLNGSALAGNELIANYPVGIMYDGTQFNIVASSNFLNKNTPAPIGLLDLSNASSGQIKFPATQNPSSNANTLDDYEEGTWVPSLQFGGAAVGMTYAVNGQAGIYVKTGRIVTANFFFTLTAKGSSTGTATVENLPYSSVSGLGGFVFVGNAIWTTMTSSLIQVVLGMNPAGTSITLYGNTAAATSLAALTHAAFANTSTLYGTLVYEASS